MKKLLAILLTLLLTTCTHRISPPRGESETNNYSEKALLGRQVFMDSCDRCHPDGLAGLGPSIFDKPLPGFLMRIQVRTGLGTMPSFDKVHLPKEDLNNLISYIKEN